MVFKESPPSWWKSQKKEGTAKYPVSICTFLSLFLNTIGWQHSQYFFTLLKVFPRNDVRRTSTEIWPYWWCVTTQLWVVLLIVKPNFQPCSHNHCPGQGGDTSSVWPNFCACYSDIRVVTKISSCRVNTSRQGNKQLGISFGSSFLLFSNKSSRQSHSL